MPEIVVQIGMRINRGMRRWHKLIEGPMRPGSGPIEVQLAGMARALAEAIEQESGFIAVRDDAPLNGSEFVAYRPFNRDGSGDRVVSIQLRQIGWYGQTGRFYQMDDSPSETEPGSYMPMYIVVDSDDIAASDLPMAMRERER